MGIYFIACTSGELEHTLRTILGIGLQSLILRGEYLSDTAPNASDIFKKW